MLAEGKARAAVAVARSLVDAFNAHDPAAMVALVTADFELYYVDADGTAEKALTGRDELSVEMTRYFAAHPDVRSKVGSAVEGPAFVAFREQIVGVSSSLAVYEVRQGLVRRAWYYPAE